MERHGGLGGAWVLALVGGIAAGACDGSGESGSQATGAEFPEGISEGETSFQNFDRGVTCTLARNLQPTSVEQAQAAVRWAAGQGLNVRPISSPSSHSENAIICPEEGGIHLSFVRMNRVLEIDGEAKEVTVEPGARMGDIGDALHAEGWALRNHIPWRDLSAAGAIATGAHHTSLRFPSGIHDMVKRLQVIDGTGEVVTLEGDEAKGASAHLGLLGAVVAVTFEIEPQFKLRATVETGDDTDFEGQIVSMAEGHDYSSFSWYLSLGKFVHRIYDIVDASEAGEAYSVNWVSTEGEQELQASLIDNLNRADDGEARMCQIEGVRFAAAGLSHAEGGRDVEDVAVGYSHQMFSSICQGKECPWNNGIKIFNPEVAIPVADLPAWMADVRALYAARGACFPVNGVVVRFSKASESWVGMNAGQDVAYVEFHIARHPDEGSHEQFADAYDELHQLTLQKYGGRPHWGKNFLASFVGLDLSSYERWADFITLKQRLDPSGIFENTFYDRLAGNAGMKLGPGCAVSRDCFCQEDSHCGDGRKCVAGLVFESARICRP